MNYHRRLIDSAQRAGSILCLGLDPVPERIENLTGKSGVDAAEEFLSEILEILATEGALPTTLKPNLAYFEQYGSSGWALLERLIARWSVSCLIILDAKRGDIGASSEAYARALYEQLGGDAVTASPWMGHDSVQPFLDRAPEKGCYLLLRTSNPGSADLQAQSWPSLAAKIRTWKGAGAVVGATSTADLQTALGLLGDEVPLLIPGVGSQGGEASSVMALLREANPALHRVNVSSGILYAGENSGQDYRTAALAACRGFSAGLRIDDPTGLPTG